MRTKARIAAAASGRGRFRQEYGFSGDIKGLLTDSQARKAPFLLASAACFLYPDNASHASGPGRDLTAGRMSRKVGTSFPDQIMLVWMELQRD